MTLPKLLLDLDASSYTAAFGNEILSVQVQNGPMRVRRDFVGAVSMVAAQWVLTDLEYQYLMAFYRSTIVMGTLPFLLDMVIDYAVVAEHQCRFMPSSLGLSAVQGDAYIVKAQLEVKPVSTDAEFDNSLTDMFDAYGDGAQEILGLLETFANVTLPANLNL